jgi:hypothetical protein
MKFVFWFPVQLLSETSLVLRKTERYTCMMKMYIDLYVKYPLFLSDFNEKLGSSWQIFFKNTQILNLIKSRPMGAELFHVDRQTDTFPNFANASKMT